MDGDQRSFHQQLIRALRPSCSLRSRKRLACGDPAVFEVSELTLDISFVGHHSRNSAAASTSRW